MKTYLTSTDFAHLFKLVQGGNEIVGYVMDQHLRTCVAIRKNDIAIIIGYPGMCYFFGGNSDIGQSDFVESCKKWNLEFILPHNDNQTNDQKSEYGNP